ncbi:MAG: enoyl-CoA hydratase/isomerase family protein, partial [Alphaproteobacteria bacterium]|nr:enoyl-CoA hydratase/isomerase family protein [Alphaproteobacteria bacterium]
MSIPPSEFQHTLYVVRDHVCTITLNRPERRNALNPRAYAEIEAAFVAASSDNEVRVVIVTGADPSFCSGEDVKEMMTGEARPADAPPRVARPTPAAMAVLDCTKPV